MTRREAAEYLKVNPRTIDRRIKDGRLTKCTDGGTVALLREEVINLRKQARHHPSS